MQKQGRSKYIVVSLAAASLAGCALYPNWHWAKPGADRQMLSHDENQCKTSVYTDASGIVTQASVRRMHACMAEKGWSRQDN